MRLIAIKGEGDRDYEIRDATTNELIYSGKIPPFMRLHEDASGRALTVPGPDFREVMLSHMKEQNRRLAALEQTMGKLTYMVQQLQNKPPEPAA